MAVEHAAVLEALKALPQDHAVIITSDSTYVVNCFRDSWWKGWLARGWKNSQRQPVANRDLWEQLIELAAVHTVEWIWVRGHANVVLNERCDRLAVAERDRYEALWVTLTDALPLPRRTDRKTLRLMLLGALNHAQTWYRPEGGASPRTLARQFTALLRQGMETPA